MITQARPKRKVSGGKYKKYRDKRWYERGNLPTLTKLGTVRKRQGRIRGGNTRTRTLTTNVVNVYDPKAKKYFQATIKTITENPANRHYVRRNIITKGTMVETDKGKARVTSRPGQEGTVNAVLV